MVERLSSNVLTKKSETSIDCLTEISRCKFPHRKVDGSSVETGCHRLPFRRDLVASLHVLLLMPQRVSEDPTRRWASNW
ncbi:hypothetical protein TNIN_229691 [Trichonephila inaurata madagascariensis]|uniref:Uncharacterized protein n=1 Tax=Trichonephila inaurata madagascariensis TaxID=2747483 RepID=A0A8X6KJ14_9ARAC|nr:hypothetical protein TNIN_229691 [Trichonephila inaurata madagascariensis]